MYRFNAIDVRQFIRYGMKIHRKRILNGSVQKENKKNEPKKNEEKIMLNISSMLSLLWRAQKKNKKTARTKNCWCLNFGQSFAFYVLSISCEHLTALRHTHSTLSVKNGRLQNHLLCTYILLRFIICYCIWPKFYYAKFSVGGIVLNFVVSAFNGFHFEFVFEIQFQCNGSMSKLDNIFSKFVWKPKNKFSLNGVESVLFVWMQLQSTS